MTFGKSFGLVAGALALGVVACGGNEPQQQARSPEVTTTTGAQSETSSMGTTQTGQTGMAETNTGGSSMQGQQQMGQTNQMQQGMGMALTDAQIVAIADAANKGEVEQGKLAVKKAKDPQVKQFAQMMVDHHGDAVNKTKTLATQLNIAPESTQTSTQLQTDSQNAISSLSGQSGADFDKAYIDLQVKEHQDVLNALDQKLIPSAHNADLKKQLSDLRPKIAEHLQKAEQIQQKLQSTK